MENNKKDLIIKLSLTIPAILGVVCFIWYLFDGSNNLLIGLGFIFASIFFFVYYLDKRIEDKKQQKETGIAFILFSIIFLLVGVGQIIILLIR